MRVVINNGFSMVIPFTLILINPDLFPHIQPFLQHHCNELGAVRYAVNTELTLYSDLWTTPTAAGEN